MRCESPTSKSGYRRIWTGVYAWQERKLRFLSMKMRLKTVVFLSMILCLPWRSFCQSSQVTSEALLRTFMIATNFGRGTTFSIDVDNREYWITAKHMFTGIENGPAGQFPAKRVQANILSQIGEGDEGHDLHWMTVSFTVIDPGKDIDILVLVPDHLLLGGLSRNFTLKAEDSGVGLGGDCEFAGFPYGGGWKTQMKDEEHPDKNDWVWLPYVKRCTVSALPQEKDLKVWVLDGINNHGFSGGPVLYGTGNKQEVFAVISGYHEEPLEVLPAPNSSGTRTNSIPPSPKLPGEKSRSEKEFVNANSGFILAYDIQPAIEAIYKDPIGPLRPETNSK